MLDYGYNIVFNKCCISVIPDVMGPKLSKVKLLSHQSIEYFPKSLVAHQDVFQQI